MFFLGMVADRRLNLGGAGTLTGILLGIAASFYWSYRAIAAHLARFAPRQDRNEAE